MCGYVRVIHKYVVMTLHNETSFFPYYLPPHPCLLTSSSTAYSSCSVWLFSVSWSHTKSSTSMLSRHWSSLLYWEPQCPSWMSMTSMRDKLPARVLSLSPSCTVQYLLYTGFQGNYLFISGKCGNHNYSVYVVSPVEVFATGVNMDQPKPCLQVPSQLLLHFVLWTMCHRELIAWKKG